MTFYTMFTFFLTMGASSPTAPLNHVITSDCDLNKVLSLVRNKNIAYRKKNYYWNPNGKNRYRYHLLE
jgi:hypothetical protein